MEYQPNNYDTASEMLDISFYVNIFRKRWIVGVLTFFLVLSIGGIYTAQVKKIYKASSVIEITRRLPPELKDVPSANLLNSDLPEDVFLQEQYRLLESKEVLQRATNKLAMFNKKIEDSPDNVKIISLPNAQVEIAVIDGNPMLAADLANAVTESYREKVKEMRANSINAINAQLLQQQKDLTDKLAQSREELDLFVRTKGFTDVSIKSRLYELRARIGQYGVELAKIETQLTYSEAKLRAYQQSPNSADQNLLKREQAALAITRNELKKKLEQGLREEAQLQLYEPIYQKLTETVQDRLASHNSIAARLEELQFVSTLKVETVNVIKQAESAKTPITPDWRKNTLLFCLLGVVLSITAMLLKESFGRASSSDKENGFLKNFLLRNITHT